MEIWKDIPGFEGNYQASNFGNLKSLSRNVISQGSAGYKYYIVKRERILKPSKESNGYFQCGLQIRNNKQRRFLVHRLVAETFIVNPNEKEFVNHINGIKTDNRVENLEWVTKSENHKHAYALGLMDNKGDNHPSNKLTSEDILEIRELVKGGATVYSLKNKYPVGYSSLKGIVRGKTWTHLL
jgi:hypothetical protein